MRFKMFHAYVLFAGFFILVASLNYGFMAFDEYWIGVTRYVPAQSSSVFDLVHEDDVKSPVQLMPMYAMAQLAYFLGVESPYWQYRFVGIALACLQVLVLLMAIREFLKLVRPIGKIYELDSRAHLYFMWIAIFYFAGSFTLTRPTFEAISAPWLFLSAVKLFSYDLKPKLGTLLWSVVWVSVSFNLRPQLGFCALAIVFLPFIKGNYQHAMVAGFVGALFFVLSGLPDLILRGSFHESLYKLVTYNVAHGKDYGEMPLYYYPMMFFLIGFGPFLFTSPHFGKLSSHLKEFRVFWWYLFLFIFLHSLFPQKWERFLISMIPFVWVLLWPLFWYFHKRFAQNRIRLGLLYAVNFLLLVTASFFPAQGNLIQLSRYLDRTPKIAQLYIIEKTPEWLTTAFIRRKNLIIEDKKQTDLLEVESSHPSCGVAYVMGKPLYQRQAANPLFQRFFNNWVVVRNFSVNWIEALSYQLNPEANKRRVELLLLRAKNCD